MNPIYFIPIFGAVAAFDYYNNKQRNFFIDTNGIQKINPEMSYIELLTIMTLNILASLLIITLI